MRAAAKPLEGEPTSAAGAATEHPGLEQPPSGASEAGDADWVAQMGHAPAAENWGENELSAALVRLAQLDVALKGGSRLPDELELERALVEVSR